MAADQYLDRLADKYGPFAYPQLASRPYGYCLNPECGLFFYKRFTAQRFCRPTCCQDSRARRTFNKRHGLDDIEDVSWGYSARQEFNDHGSC